MLVRQSAPVLGALRGPYLGPKAWEFNSSFRTLRADNHFKGTEEQTERHEGRRTYKINRQHMLDWSAAYGLDRQTTLTLSIPLISANRSNKNSGGGRSIEAASGLGDVSLVARRWMLNTERNTKGNFAFGFGIKAPTGDYKVTDDFPDPKVPNKTFRKPVDQSIQLGDGGWGIIFDLQGFRRVGSATLFGSALYLANPRDQNGTISSTSGGKERAHSVADQFLLRLGASVPVKGAQGLAFTLAGRMEGVPHGDLFGDNNGARRPAISVFVEPGIVYSNGNSTWSVGVPLVAMRRTFRSKLSGDDYQDATLADYIVLASFTRRFGGPDERPIRRLPRENELRRAEADTDVACSACSHKMSASAKFCSECGAKLTAAAAQPIQSGANPAAEPVQNGQDIP